MQPTVRDNIGQTWLTTDPIQSSKPSAAMEALQNSAANSSICTEHAREKPQQFSAASNSAKFGWILLVRDNKRNLSAFSSLFLSYSVKLPIPALKQIAGWNLKMLWNNVFSLNVDLRSSKSISAASFQKFQLEADSGLKRSSWTAKNWQHYLSKNKVLYWKVVDKLNCRYCWQLHL